MEMRMDFHNISLRKVSLILLKNMAVNACVILERICTCGAWIMVGGKNFRDVTDQVWSPEKRIAGIG